jgi:hypothetical protein
MKTFKMSEGEYRDHRDEYNGLCIACGAVAYGDTEPDAENYKCEVCGKDRVQGIENLMIMGLIEII